MGKSETVQIRNFQIKGFPRPLLKQPNGWDFAKDQSPSLVAATPRCMNGFMFIRQSVALLEKNSVMTLDLSSNYNATDELCRQETSSQYQILWIATIAVIMFCNIFLLIAILKSWTILRRNVVNRYLVSCLFSAVAFCAASAFEMLHTVYHADETFLGESVLQRYNASLSLHSITMQRYAYRKGLLPTLALVMQYNITALIYAVSENALFVGRHADIPSSDPIAKVQRRANNSGCLHSSKRRKPIVVCVLSWILPILCSVPVAFGWNCVHHCKCLPAYRWISSCQPDFEDSRICSRTWLPVSRSFVIFITVLSFTAIVLNFSLLTCTIRKFHRTHAPRHLYNFGEVYPPPGNTETVSEATISCSNDLTNSVPSLPGLSVINLEQGVRNEESTEENERNSSRSQKKYHPPLDQTLKLLIAVTLSMFISVTPLISIWFFDVMLLTDVSNGIGFPIALSFSYAYAALLPFILLKFMFGLQKALRSLIFKCPMLHKTVITTTTTTTAAPSTTEGTT